MPTHTPTPPPHPRDPDLSAGSPHLRGILHDRQAVTFVEALICRGHTLADVQCSWNAISIAVFRRQAEEEAGELP